MKKICCFVMVIVLFILCTSSAFAACSHSSTTEDYLYSSWRHLDKGSGMYASEHYRDVYVRVYCALCGVFLEQLFVTTEFAGHSLPCSLCGAK